ncbi:chemotaxis protein CheB [Geminicoccus roseus]|uniref:chemotaxis protein CheB n=1 Tax=Geminicoccus roseus TaxID=404900 RepID=UPI00040964D9|nr:chemotaxis protein CheB [Geminicoccus roseus]
MGNHDIIVIGGSAGATAPLKALIRSLPADLPAAVFIVLHIPARSIGILSTVLSASGSLPVRQAQHGMAIKPGQIYLAAPDHHLILAGGVVRLGRGPRENMMRPSIDPLFRSAAAAYGPRVIGVILSGFLNDGASGLVAIKRCGGMAVVQDPADAVAQEMPQNALLATAVDLCVPGARLSDALADLAREPAGIPLPVAPDIRLEVDIAAGERVDSQVIQRLGNPLPLTCPNCQDVLSMVRESRPLRFRCQVGHGFTAEVAAKEQEDAVDEALRVALRIIEERAELVTRMAKEARSGGRHAVAEIYADRAEEYRHNVEVLRRAVLKSMAEPAPDQG